MSSFGDLLKGEIGIGSLLAKLDFTDTNISDAATKQSKLFIEAGKYRIRKMRKRTRAESNLSLVTSEAALRIRKKYLLRGEKLTEGHLKAILTKNQSVREATEAYELALEEEEFAKLLVEAFRMRRDSTKVVVEMMTAEVHLGRTEILQSKSIEEMKEVRRKLNAKYPGK